MAGSPLAVSAGRSMIGRRPASAWTCGGRPQPALDPAAVVVGDQERRLSPATSALPPAQQIDAPAAFRQRACLEEATDQRLMAGMKLLDECGRCAPQMLAPPLVGPAKVALP